MGDRNGLIEDCRMTQSVLCDTSEIDVELAEVRSELEVVSELSRKAIYENARTAMSGEWSERNNSYLERHKQASQRQEELEVRKRERLVKVKPSKASSATSRTASLPSRSLTRSSGSGH